MSQKQEAGSRTWTILSNPLKKTCENCSLSTADSYGFRPVCNHTCATCKRNHKLMQWAEEYRIDCGIAESSVTDNWVWKKPETHGKS